MRHLLCVAVIFVLSGAAGCHGGVPAPKGWVNVGGGGAGGEAVADRDDRGALQVIICYGAHFSNHAALRLTCPGRLVLFWDPGGNYGEDDPGSGRARDLILARPPTIQQWWDYRRNGCREPIMAVYEWELSGHDARAMHGVLLHGLAADEPGGPFHSDAPGWYCSLSICDFLARCGGKAVAMPQRWFLPLNLGKHLWTQSPDRVTIFRDQQPPAVYTQPLMASGRE